MTTSRTTATQKPKPSARQPRAPQTAPAQLPSLAQLAFMPTEARRLLKIGVNRMSQMLNGDPPEIPSVKLGDRIRRIKRLALEDYLARITTGNATDAA